MKLQCTKLTYMFIQFVHIMDKGCWLASYYFFKMSVRLQNKFIDCYLLKLLILLLTKQMSELTNLCNLYNVYIISTSFTKIHGHTF